jgi:hypothetical protein
MNNPHFAIGNYWIQALLLLLLYVSELVNEILCLKLSIITQNVIYKKFVILKCYIFQ